MHKNGDGAGVLSSTGVVMIGSRVFALGSGSLGAVRMYCVTAVSVKVGAVVMTKLAAATFALAAGGGRCSEVV